VKKNIDCTKSLESLWDSSGRRIKILREPWGKFQSPQINARLGKRNPLASETKEDHPTRKQNIPRPPKKTSPDPPKKNHGTWDSAEFY
jgi:hypothetical protein